MMDEDLLGWYSIGETWNLYVDGGLAKVHVAWICVDEPTDGTGYHVDHYGGGGELITSLTLDHDDIEPELRDRETEDRPQHI